MKFVLFKGRHSHPEIDGLPAIFPDGVDVMDFARLFEIATAAVSQVEKVHDERLDLFWRIQKFLDESKPKPGEEWNVHDYHRHTASIRRQSQELSQVLVDLRRPL